MKVLRKMFLFLFLFVCVLLTNVSGFAADKGDFSIEPTTNNGAKWRIGYYEGGEYITYQKVLKATIEQLMQLGWIETAEIPPQKGEQTKDLWNWLVNNTKSDYLEFVEDAHYTANWDDNLREKIVVELIERLNQKKDIDFMFVLGTWAGLDMANDKHQTPMMSLSASDPLGAGIIKSIEDSGYDHVFARVDPFRDDRQIRIFYDIIEFQKLGVAYEDTESGRTQAAIDKIEKCCGEYGFEVVRCYTTDESPDVKVDEKSVKACFRELGEKGVDAIYVTVQTGVNTDSVPELVKIVNSYKIPTFSQDSSDEVRYGFLLSISQAGFKYEGRFYAETLAKILNGAKPRQLDQVFEAPPKIAINLKTAEIIGYDPPVDVLGAADEIYQEIEKPE